MLLFGTEAIANLIQASEAGEARKSSYWQDMHSREHWRKLELRDGRLVNMPDFGIGGRRLNPAAQLANHALATPWRVMGRAFPSFPHNLAVARHLARRQELAIDHSYLRQILTVSMLKTHFPDFSGVATVIGDGYGILAAQILAAWPGARVVNVNLARTLVMDYYHVARTLPEGAAALATSRTALDQALADPAIRAIALQADNADWLTGKPLALAANIASMQEMHPDIVADYFRILRASTAPSIHFYCCNRIEKDLGDGTMVRFHDFPWRDDDTILIDGPCPWHERWYSLRPPFFGRFAGAIHHRLARLHQLPG